MIISTLERRLRRIEEQRSPAAPLQGIAILVNSIEEAPPLIAEKEAGGTYKPGWPLIIITGRPTTGVQP
ncbi:hypothetical protein [Methylobacterium soli]|uniref:Uncharacterized protein n=1 Tax=Methylobacterium soli TaxID=553447 RepID=A0A6L3SYE1_9HYPH|nr:hypothetical protein [Methylobacterium soli]KAB1078228.1 hypothetical protein F6X53_15865 [Methylobacterium soli]GJE45049.1 hypothetical protein AEGHOMDF_4243 [Methylobacterium soli]